MSSPKLVLDLPLTLQSISPTLSAFHVSRMKSHLRSGGEEVEDVGKRPIIDLTDTHCPRCRRFQLDGSADTRLVRNNKHRATSVILQKICRSCGFAHRTPLIKGGAASFQNQRKRNRQNQNPSGTKSEREGKTQPATPTETLSYRVSEPAAVTSDGVVRKSKNRKARSGLQVMLERKKKQDQAKSTGTSSLASFLQEL